MPRFGTSRDLIPRPPTAADASEPVPGHVFSSSDKHRGMTLWRRPLDPQVVSPSPEVPRGRVSRNSSLVWRGTPKRGVRTSPVRPCSCQLRLVLRRVTLTSDVWLLL
jgi:hypothetical protein